MHFGAALFDKISKNVDFSIWVKQCCFVIFSYFNPLCLSRTPWGCCGWLWCGREWPWSGWNKMSVVVIKSLSNHSAQSVKNVQSVFWKNFVALWKAQRQRKSIWKRLFLAFGLIVEFYHSYNLQAFLSLLHYFFHF